MTKKLNYQDLINCTRSSAIRCFSGKYNNKWQLLLTEQFATTHSEWLQLNYWYIKFHRN